MTETRNGTDGMQENSNVSEGTAVSPSSTSFLNRYKAELGLAAVVLYVLLLALGTIGELFDVEWILDLPLFRPPGKY